MILVVKDSFMVCPNAWVCRLIVPSDLYSFLSHNHLASPNGAAATPFGREQKYCCVIDRQIVISSNLLDPLEIKC